jgi:hypothetical protein
MRKFKIGDTVTVIKNGSQYSTSHRLVDGSDTAMNKLAAFPNQKVTQTNYTNHNLEVVDVLREDVDWQGLTDGDQAVVIAYDTHRNVSEEVYVIQVGEKGYAIGEGGIAKTNSTQEKLHRLKSKLKDRELDFVRIPKLKIGLDLLITIMEGMERTGEWKIPTSDVKVLNELNRMVNEH